MRDDEGLTDRMPSGPLSPRELQETRLSNHLMSTKVIPADDLKEWGRKVDRLWLCLGWLPMTVTNWKAILVAIILATLIGGQSFIDRIALALGGYLP